MTYSIIKRFGWSIRLTALLVFVAAQIVFKPYEQVSAQSNSVTFPVGLGFSDVIPHQIVRTVADRVYIFGGKAHYSTALVGYWTTAAGLPTATSSFNGTTTLNEATSIMSVDAVYDGGTIIHVLVNTIGGEVIDHPFNTTTNTFRAAIPLASDGGTINTDYMGTSGLSGMVDLSGQLHVSYWAVTPAPDNHVMHQVYTYDSQANTLAMVGTATQVDTNGAATHPALAVSPVDNSVTIAWVSDVNTPTGDILARTRSAAGVWGAVETVSTTDVWTSNGGGINIDQGPSLVIGLNGKKFISYIEDFDPIEYGRIHLATYDGTWTDSVNGIAIAGSDPELVVDGSTYTHDPALAINDGGQLFIIGHGPSNNLHNTNRNMYTIRRNANGSWAVPVLFKLANTTLNETFDSSASVRWSVVGNTRPGIYEFVYFLAVNGSYNETKLYYGRFDDPASAFNPTVAPARNYFVTSTPDLTWNRVTGATEYQVEVAKTNTFGASVVFTATVPADTLIVNVNPVQPLTNGIYFWRVRAKQNGVFSPTWSIVERFEVNAP